ncbi:hypothetical protein ACQ4LE_006561 [Meloidogyne hapla]|uniref:Uncharacterized protein n=1 Tax=Meloidogyne hapla TaxID=6305 RepID=A0A1I8BSR0_MELHA
MQVKRKGLPVELLLDVFNVADSAILKLFIRKKHENSKLKNKEFETVWTYYVKNLLTSSSTVNVLVGKFFRERWTSMLKIIRIERLERLKERNAEIDVSLSKTVEIIFGICRKISKADGKIRRLYEEKARMVEEIEKAKTNDKIDRAVATIGKLNEEKARFVEERARLLKRRRSKLDEEEDSPVAKHTRKSFSKGKNEKK